MRSFSISKPTSGSRLPDSNSSTRRMPTILVTSSTRSTFTSEPEVSIVASPSRRLQVARRRRDLPPMS